jgi:16S rRNA processing protein RimM
LLLNVAQVGAPVGLKGDVRLSLRTDTPDARLVVGAVLSVAGEGVSLTVVNVRKQDNHYIVRFRGVENRTASEQLRGKMLQIETTTAESLDGDSEFYYADLAGLQVRLAQDNQLVGVVRNVIAYPAQDLLDVAISGEKSVLIPFVRQIVPEINLSEGYILIDPPSGLLDGALDE